MFTEDEDLLDDINLVTEKSKLVDDIGSLYLNEQFFDVTFSIDREKVRAHKAVLAVRSKQFETLFEANSQEKLISVPNTSAASFKLFLQYVYRGTITIPSDIELIVQVLVLATQYSFRFLATRIVLKINTILDENNVCFLLNEANKHDLDELQNVCLSFIDHNALIIQSCDSFNQLTPESLIQILKRGNFQVPEIEIFNSVAKWYKCNDKADNTVLNCVRLSLLTVAEILTIVWPTNLVHSDKLLEAISEIVDDSSNDMYPKALIPKNENILQCRAEVVSELGSTLLNENREVVDVQRSVHHNIDGKDGIVIRLSRPHLINHIHMMLYDIDNRSYSYYVETSLDRRKWHRIIDYTKYACRSVQTLYFDEEVSQYIKIVGTNNVKGNNFHLMFFEVMYKSKVPRMMNGVICPETNVATPQNNALVVQGHQPEYLLNGKYEDDESTYHYQNATKGTNGITVQLAQPYVISSMQLLLCEHNNRTFKYFIETSVNQKDWEIVIDRRDRDCRSWQDLHFEKRIVVFIRITGTYCSQYNMFCCVHFQCPAGRAS